ncbi:MAG: threonine-phosphate decarboxylase CobD [Jaaginema sp. PMC 1079.18]|nr:threonine-phosphate decarboxylase CobD [Jaaginema sp. PMC 1080.18]MEC4851114.1 threonine-phosphate decarboxylase CobD [Jaaginema sp. PMC 1079.18]MEC4867372.1 threonine-phosphate decarboxylase CobD [Jaaginema sp. PMC 1078.18]
MKRPHHGGNLVWAASLAGCSPDEILDFSASINPLGLPDTAIAAIQGGMERLRSYPDPNYTDLRDRLAQAHNLAPEWILPGNGAAELLTWIGRDLAQFEATYLWFPAFRDYTRALQAFGGAIVPQTLVLPDWDMPSSGEIAPHSSILVNNPHNPTGRIWTREELLPLLDKFDLVVVDEAFMDFLPPSQSESLVGMVSQHENLVILRSLTKFYSLPGLRLGYAIAPPDRLQRWQEWRDPWSVNILADLAAQAVLGDTEFQQRTHNWLKKARSHLFEQLEQIPGLRPFPGAANFLLVETQGSSVELQRQLLEGDRILIRDCLSFPELGDRYFRVAVRTIAENQRLVEGLRRI